MLSVGTVNRPEKWHCTEVTIYLLMLKDTMLMSLLALSTLNCTDVPAAVIHVRYKFISAKEG